MSENRFVFEAEGATIVVEDGDSGTWRWAVNLNRVGRDFKVSFHSSGENVGSAQVALHAAIGSLSKVSDGGAGDVIRRRLLSLPRLLKEKIREGES